MKNNDKFDLTVGGEGNREPLDIFEPFFDGVLGYPMFNRKDFNRMNNIMRTDVKEGEKDYTLEIEMPGFDKKDINLDLKDGYLTVTAKREHNYDDKKENYIRKERSYGSFSRSFYVGDVKKEDVEASLDNGMLKIVLPKEQKKVDGSNRIEIK